MYASICSLLSANVSICRFWALRVCLVLSWILCFGLLPSAMWTSKSQGAMSCVCLTPSTPIPTHTVCLVLPEEQSHIIVYGNPLLHDVRVTPWLPPLKWLWKPLLVNTAIPPVPWTLIPFYRVIDFPCLCCLCCLCCARYLSLPQRQPHLTASQTFLFVMSASHEILYACFWKP